MGKTPERDPKGKSSSIPLEPVSFGCYSSINDKNRLVSYAGIAAVGSEMFHTETGVFTGGFWRYILETAERQCEQLGLEPGEEFNFNQKEETVFLSEGNTSNIIIESVFPDTHFSNLSQQFSDIVGNRFGFNRRTPNDVFIATRQR